MTKETLEQLHRIEKRYSKYNGITTEKLIEMVEAAPITEHEAVLTIRFLFGMAFDETEIFSIDDVMELTKKSKEEVTEQMNELGITPLHFSSTLPGLFN